MSSLKVLKTEGAENLRSRFRDAVSSLAKLAAEEGVSLVPFHEFSLPIFSALGDEARGTAVRDAEEMNSLWRETRQGGGTLSNSRQLLWRFLSRMKLHIPADFLELYRDDWVIEIYNRDGLQIFRSFSVFRFTSFSLEELLSIPWWERYHRENEDHGFLLEIQKGIFDGEIRGCLQPASRPHLLKEVGSAEELHLDFDAKLFAPVFFGNDVFGLIGCSAARSREKELG